MLKPKFGVSHGSYRLWAICKNLLGILRNSWSLTYADKEGLDIFHSIGILKKNLINTLDLKNIGRKLKKGGKTLILF